MVRHPRDPVRVARSPRFRSSTVTPPIRTWIDLTEASLAHLRVFAQLISRGGVDDRASLQDIAAGGALQRHVGVLLNEQDRRALFVYLLDNLEDALHQHRRKTHRG